MITQVIQLCDSTSSGCGHHHLVRWIGRGLHTLLVNCLGTGHTPGVVISSHDNDKNNNPSPGDASSQYPSSDGHLHTMSDASIMQDAGPQTAFMMPGTGLGGIGTVPDGMFGMGDPQCESMDYASGGVDDSAYLAPGSQTQMEQHMEQFGLNFGLFK